ncbi:hypothetical protein [Actinoplanes palleronii]|uniref:Uncharacterized protein n=1 Tax=Actinoplanes palleronii TaxID=113570 RepID=A0ABQ4BE83_9ACTN|nr:hypothetical protein [Actinoplanes palleronii]GIE68954.1 hypothetical protein Apa02nite_050620 [Actinoplanes palleronii]
MNFVPQLLLADSMTPVIVWMMLMVAAFPAAMLLASPQAVHRPGQLVMAVVDVLRCHLEAREQARREAAAAVRFADEVKASSVRADAAVRYRQELWRESGQHAGDTWLTWQAAEQDVARARAAAAFTAPWSARTPTEYAERERFLHRTVRDAVQRGDLPTAALAAALAGRGGWDPRLHPVEQELVLLRAVAEHRQRCHQQATVVERAAWHDIRTAVTDRDRMRAEAAAAVHRAARQRLRPVREHWTIPALRLTWGHQLAVR